MDAVGGRFELKKLAGENLSEVPNDPDCVSVR
jgi:hypothetical protein